MEFSKQRGMAIKFLESFPEESKFTEFKVSDNVNSDQHGIFCIGRKRTMQITVVFEDGETEGLK